MKLVIGIMCGIVFFPFVIMAFLMFYLPIWLLTDRTMKEIHKGWWK